MAEIKPRWKEWECKCIRKAAAEKIQLKVMAIALGKTLTSVSKKIKTLGLRDGSSKAGRSKGDISHLSRVEKTSHDAAKMEHILKTYAPLKVFQKGQLALKEGHWVSAVPLHSGLQKGKSIGYLSQENASFSQSFPLKYILTKDSLPCTLFKENIKGFPCYVSLSYVEKWALTEGFSPLPKNLKQQGLFFWKKGKYFSKAQLLLYINDIRLAKKLRPLAFYEDERDLYAKNPGG